MADGQIPCDKKRMPSLVSSRQPPFVVIAVVGVLTALSARLAQAQATQSDKVLYATVSAALVDGVWVAAAALDQPIEVRLGAAVGVAAAAGLAKEGLDLLGFGRPEVMDLVYDGLGIALGVGIALVGEVIAARAAGPPTDGD